MENGKIKIVLIGDSIRQLGYGPRLQKELGDDYVIWQPGDNCRFAKYTLRLLFEQQDHLKNVDLVHWNNGLWDCTHLTRDGLFTPYEEYEENMLRIARLLQSLSPHVIFATSTPVDPKNPYDNNEEIKEYNDRLVKKLIPMGVGIDDLYSLFEPHIEEYIRQTDLIHPTDLGAEVMTKQVARSIKEELATPRVSRVSKESPFPSLDDGRPVLVKVK